MQFMVTLLENPFRVGLRQERTPDPLILTIFGASGDLTQRKLVPAIYQMKREHRLPSELTVVGFARRDWSHDHFRDQMRQGIEEFADGIGLATAVCDSPAATSWATSSARESRPVM